jgi:ribosomal protein S13
LARIAGVDLPKNKRVEIGLTYIYGIGRERSNVILNRAKVDKETKVSKLTEDEINRIREHIEDFKVEGDLNEYQTIDGYWQLSRLQAQAFPSGSRSEDPYECPNKKRPETCNGRYPKKTV